MAKRKTSRRTRSARPARRAASDGALKRWWTGLPADRRHGVTVGSIRFVVILMLIAGGAVGMHYLRGFVMSQPSYGDSVARVELTPRPAWMSDMLAAEIAGQLAQEAGAGQGTFDPTLAQRVHAAAEWCVWISRVHEVRIERAPAATGDAAFARGRVIVVAEYRRPEAIAVAGSDERYVDACGVVLPTAQAWRHMGGEHVVRIVGLPGRAPAIGGVWGGADMAAAIRMIRLLRSKPYYREIAAVDVRNFDHRYDRAEPSIRLVALSEDRVTDIRFGELPADDLPPVGGPSLRRRIAYLDGWYRRNASRLAGPTYLDLRFGDRIRYSSTYRPAYQ